jgi:hypothetical protein
MTKMVYCLLPILALLASGCSNTENVGEAVQAIYKPGLATDISWWTHDDEDGAETSYTTFDMQSFRVADDDGVFVDVPDCKTTDTFTVSFTAHSRGSFEYMASLRLMVGQSGDYTPIHGAQTYIEPRTALARIAMHGVFTVNKNETCRVALAGKAFTGALAMVGAATMVVERHR